MAFSPKGLWFAIVTVIALLRPAGDVFGGSSAEKRFRIKYSDSFRAGKGGDLSTYPTLQKIYPGAGADSVAPQPLVLQRSSFPMRLVVGDIDQTASALVPQEALDPGGLQRRYKVEGCVLVISTGEVALTVFGYNDAGELQIVDDAVYTNSVFTLGTRQQFIVGASAELAVKISDATQQECARRFSGRRVYLGKAGFRDVVVFAVTGAMRTSSSVMDAAPVRGVWLDWTDAGRGPLLELENGYSAMIESGRHALVLDNGEFYVAMRLSWQLTRP